MMSNEATTFMKQLLEQSIKVHASDIHFQPLQYSENVSIFFRILGERKYVLTISNSFYEMMLTYLKFKSNMDIGETRRPQNGTIHWLDEETDQYLDLRLSTLPLNHSESLSIRIFLQENSLNVNELFLFPFQFNKMKNWLSNGAGIILFTGPTGSGKSTTMYALLENMITTKSIQVITLEEPVERKMDHIIQVEVNERAGITYQTGLKAALRHDPDVILIGEIRDEKTAKFAFRAALTGHLVLSTLHAKNALGTIDRLIDLGIKRADLQQSLIAIAALQLLPVKVRGEMNKRAAIAEMLEGRLLEKAINGETVTKCQLQTFKKLKEKAACYGFI